MKTKHSILLFLFLGLLTFNTFAQPARLLSGKAGPAGGFTPDEQRQLNSLNQIISKNKHDTSVSSAYVGLSEMLYVSNIDTLKYLCEIAKDIAEKNLAKSSLKAAEKKAFRITLADALNNIGYVYDIKGDIPRALEYYNKSLMIQEETGYQEGMVSSLNNIGYIYMNKGDSSLALEYYHRSLKIEEAMGYQEGMASSLNNIGIIYSDEGDFSLALEYYYKSLKIKEEIGDKKGVAYSLNNIGNIYNIQGDFSLALEYYHKSLKIKEEIGDKKGVAYSLNNIGRIALEQGDLREAKTLATKSLELSNELGFPAIIRNASKLLSDVLKKEDNYEEALKMHELYITMRDSVLNQEIRNAALKKKAQHQIEKKETKIKLLDKENEIKEAKIIYQRNIVIGVTIGILMLLLLLWRLSTKNASLKLASRTLEASNKTISMQKDQGETNLAKLKHRNVNLKEQIETLKSPETHIITLNSSGLRLDINKIYYIESQNRYVLITYHAEKVESIYERTSLKDFIQNLPPDFVQIHRSYCVNITKIKSRVGKYKLIMKDNQLLSISKSQVAEFDKVIGNSQH